MHPRTLLATTAALALIAAAAGCGTSAGAGAAASAAPVASTPPSGTPASSAGPSATTLPTVSGAAISARDFAGHWQSGQYGDAYLQVDGTAVSMVYAHDDGRFLGTVAGATLTGWWTEAPTRTPSQDAGDAEFTLGRDGAGAGAGALTMHGKWRRGTTGEFQADWDMVKVDETIPAEVRSTLADRSQFVRHP